jgi:hypothetical protein
MKAAILDRRPATPGKVSPDSVTSDFVRLFALDRLPARRLVCRWQRDADGRLVCTWEPDIVPVSQF